MCDINIPLAVLGIYGFLILMAILWLYMSHYYEYFTTKGKIKKRIKNLEDCRISVFHKRLEARVQSLEKQDTNSSNYVKNCEKRIDAINTEIRILKELLQ